MLSKSKLLNNINNKKLKFKFNYSKKDKIKPLK